MILTRCDRCTGVLGTDDAVEASVEIGARDRRAMVLCPACADRLRDMLGVFMDDGQKWAGLFPSYTVDVQVDGDRTVTSPQTRVDDPLMPWNDLVTEERRR